MSGPEQPVAAGGGAAEGRRGPWVTVGVDGSPESRAALAHALVAAAGRRAGLDVVSAFVVGGFYAGAGAPLVVPDVAAIREDVDARARSLVQEVLSDPALAGVPGIRDVEVRVVVAPGPAAQVLLDASAGADLLVVGSRGRGGLRSVLLGSVGLHCATHAGCPVLVVHPEAGERPDGPVVVGFDGSDGARAALSAALEEATRAGTDVEVVAVYSVVDYWTDLERDAAPSEEAIRADLEERTRAAVAVAVADREAAGAAVPRIDVSVVDGASREVLVERSRTARLLVVGSRGRGTVRGLLLGSVALHCAMHAHGDVLVVHPVGEGRPTVRA